MSQRKMKLIIEEEHDDFCQCNKCKIKKLNTKTIHGLTYIIHSRLGECGASHGDNKTTLYLPFFLMGACGHDDAVISWDGRREKLVAPKKMNYKWFELLAKKIKDNSNFDWDWDSFSKNILEPNREHIKAELGISEEKVSLLLSDGYVFINNFHRSFAEEGDDCVEGVDGVGYYPNFKNFIEKDNLEY